MLTRLESHVYEEYQAQQSGFEHGRCSDAETAQEKFLEHELRAETPFQLGQASWREETNSVVHQIEAEANLRHQVMTRAYSSTVDGGDPSIGLNTRMDEIDDTIEELQGMTADLLDTGSHCTRQITELQTNQNGGF